MSSSGLAVLAVLTGASVVEVGVSLRLGHELAARFQVQGMVHPVPTRRSTAGATP